MASDKKPACETGFADIPEGTTLETALRKYSGHKRWVTKYASKVNKLMGLIETQYDRRADEKLEYNLQRAENEIAALSQVAEYLKQLRYDKYKDHLEDVEKLESDIEKAWEVYNVNSHKRATQNVPASPKTRPPPVESANSVKLASDLKPDTLCHDGTAGDLRLWQTKFEAYYHASHMHLARIQVQQAYMLNCLDRELGQQLTSSMDAQTPVLGARSCTAKLNEIFKKRYPLLLRRKMFFQMSQQAGQDERAFLEQLKEAAAEADIESMDVQDAICLCLVTGLKDIRLKEKLGGLENPNLNSFSLLIDSHMHAKATAGDTAVGNRAAVQNQNKGRNKPNSSGNKGPSEAEKKRRQVMKGKCFRCGSSDHFANVCQLPKDIKCRKCGTQGHVLAACVSAGQARQASDQPEPLAIEYQVPSPQVQQQSAQIQYAHARFAAKDNNSKPTPPLML